MAKQWLTMKLLGVVARYARYTFDIDTKRFMECQERVVLDRVAAGRDTAYGRDHSFSSVTSLAEFRASQPVTDYSHYAPYVRRIADGEKDVLFSDKLRSLACTSGTSGSAKLMPVSQALLKNLLSGVFVLLERQKVLFPGTGQLQRQMRPVVAPRWRTSPGGVWIGPASVAPPGERDGREHTQFLYSAPAAANNIPSEPDAIYVHLLFALKDRELGVIEANFASFVYGVFAALERNWPRLVRDIAAGRLGDDVTVPDDVRRELEAALQPDPARAEELRCVFESGFGGGVARRVWPHLACITTVTSGAMSLYAEQLRARYTGDVPLYSAMYAATEGLLGINLWPDRDPPAYVLHPHAMLFEFIEVAHSPEDSGNSEVDRHKDKYSSKAAGDINLASGGGAEVPLLASEVRRGGVYELVVTSRSGMYRFRIGDVVKVIDFYNQAPVVQFMYRKGQLLDVRSEKMSESAFYAALRSTVGDWSAALVDYTVAESVLSEAAAGAPPHYIVFLETAGAPPSPQQAQRLDEVLCAQHEVYRSFRAKNAIGPARVVCVRSGAFERLRCHLLDGSDTSPLQFKVPRVLRDRRLVERLLGEEVPLPET